MFGNVIEIEISAVGCITTKGLVTTMNCIERYPIGSCCELALYDVDQAQQVFLSLRVCCSKTVSDQMRCNQ